MTDRSTAELDAIKRLLVLLLMKLGASADEIGLALKVSGRRVRQLVPRGTIKKVTLSTETE